MNPTAAQEVAAHMDSPIDELQDFDRVVQIYWPRVFRFVLASVRDSEIANTLTQDCFWRAHRGRNRFRGDSSLNTWLLHIAVNLVHDFNRNRRIQFWKRTTSSAIDSRSISDWIPDPGMSPETKTVIKEQVDAVWAATLKLPEKQRTVFLLRFVEDMDLLEIAAAMHVTEGSVKVHLFRALRTLRKLMESQK